MLSYVCLSRKVIKVQIPSSFYIQMNSWRCIYVWTHLRLLFSILQRGYHIMCKTCYIAWVNKPLNFKSSEGNSVKIKKAGIPSTMSSNKGINGKYVTIFVNVLLLFDAYHLLVNNINKAVYKIYVLSHKINCTTKCLHLYRWKFSSKSNLLRYSYKC